MRSYIWDFVKDFFLCQENCLNEGSVRITGSQITENLRYSLVLIYPDFGLTRFNKNQYSVSPNIHGSLSLCKNPEPYEYIWWR